MPNLFKTFKDLIPDPPLMVGTVSAVVAGQCVINLPGGGQVAGRGAATVGEKVFVRDGFIEGVAPNLTMEIIEI
ncbi:MAG: hypothetical protein NVSMB36_19270 [Escherichia coli]